MTTLDELLAGTWEEKAKYLGRKLAGTCFCCTEHDMSSIFFDGDNENGYFWNYEMLASLHGVDLLERSMVERGYSYRSDYFDPKKDYTILFWKRWPENEAETYGKDKTTAIIDAAIKALWEEG